jgi:hypothetical protein
VRARLRACRPQPTEIISVIPVGFVLHFWILGCVKTDSQLKGGATAVVSGGKALLKSLGFLGSFCQIGRQDEAAGQSPPEITPFSSFVLFGARRPLVSPNCTLVALQSRLKWPH